MMRVLLAFSIALLALSGCSNEVGLAGAGEACVRTAQCDRTLGLACVGGFCSTDLGPLGEAGVLPAIDAGPVMDAIVPADTGVPPVDSGTPPADSGTPPVDSGTPPADSGTPPADSGTPPADSGTPPADSGTPPMDSGTPPADSGTPPADATVG
ncbi:MAG: hypothetical protein DRJ42_12600 [Deltaproteobacteria bacterium]|nr:MAG: hypothetical protein DRJ42_12600 [Deltaproteobacteria bacterium]